MNTTGFLGIDMDFTKAYKACVDCHTVYYKNEPCVIEYTTAGGPIRPAEGVAYIRLLDSDQRFRVSVHDIGQKL